MDVMLGWPPTDDECRVIAERWPDDLRLLPHDAESIATGEVRALVGGATEQQISQCPRLELVQLLGHGLDPYLTIAGRTQLHKRGVSVCCSRPAAVTIAEFAIMSMILLARRVLPLHRALSLDGDWSHQRRKGRLRGSLGGELQGHRLGMIGYGDIGQAVAQRASAFGMAVTVVTRTPDRQERQGTPFDRVHGLDQVAEALRDCHFVVVSLPRTPATYGLIDAEALRSLPRGAVVVNVARGGIVDEDALVDALEDQHLAGAALDVFEAEQGADSAGYPLRRAVHHHNVLLTPHFSGATRESRIRALSKAGDNLRRLVAGEPLTDAVDGYLL